MSFKKLKTGISLFVLFTLLALVVGCNKDESVDPVTPDINSLTDIDGNVYHIVKIGNQYWTVENLKVTKYRNGDPIPNITDSAQWLAQTAGAYCNYDNNASNAAVYGRLYNWFTVMDPRKVAPPGWHVPTDNEWTTLAIALGGELTAGGKMKEAGLTHWITPNSGADNSSGFTALPAGYRADGFALLGYGTTWWSTTEADSVSAWAPWIMYNSARLGRTSQLGTGAGKVGGLSVRLVKD